MSELRPRIVASEMEWQVAEKPYGEPLRQFSEGFEVAGNYIHPGVQKGSSMLSNGSRYYNDIDYLEYATPEDTRLIEGVVTNELAGELFVIDSLTRYIKDREDIEKIILSKRVADDDSNAAWGYHINLSADREAIPEVDDEHLHLLGLHFASSQPMLGAGMVCKPRGLHTRYSFGQKVLSIEEDFNHNSVKARPLIHRRDEPHGPRDYMRRMHLINTDAHVSPWATAMTFGTTSLVLRAIEQGRKNELRLSPSAYYTNKALAHVAIIAALDEDRTQTRPFEDGNRYTMLEVQKKIIEIVEKVDYTDEEAWVLEEWKQAVSDQESDIMLLDGRSDAITKLALIHREMARSGDDDWASKKIKAIDNLYGTIATINREDIINAPVDAWSTYRQSMAHKLRSQKFARYMPDTDDINRRVTEPPETTRAAIRGHLIKHYKVMTANWQEVLLGGDSPRTVNLYPYDTTIHATYGTNASKDS